jgi:hypothetical protein
LRYFINYREWIIISFIFLQVERKENVDTDNIVAVSERGSISSDTIYLGTGEYFICLNIVILCALTTDKAQQKFLNSELQRVSRNEKIMTNFAKALWTVLKQYKHKLLVICCACLLFMSIFVVTC